MAFETLSDRLRLVADSSLVLTRNNWGGNGLKSEQPIDPVIGWQPTFFVRPSKVLMIAVEVSDHLFPEVLKIAAHDIERYDAPIAVYQACSLDVFQNDQRMARVNLLRDHGFGVITVDEAGMAIVQTHAQPLAQHIRKEQFDEGIRALSPRLKVVLRSAYTTYQANVAQGLQEAGQLIEAIVKCIAGQAATAQIIPALTPNHPTAIVIDQLYAAQPFAADRAALGGARHFVTTYRNVASHPAKSASEAARKIRACKLGFLEALRIADALRIAAKRIGYRLVVH